jgi:putative ABC transport system permease protein
METFRQDLRYAFRTLRRNPAYVAIIVLVLALGIGANALIFSVINVVLLMRFPYNDAERLVLVQTINLKGAPGGVAPANFLDWRREARSFECTCKWAATRFRAPSSSGGSRRRRLPGGCAARSRP